MKTKTDKLNQAIKTTLFAASLAVTPLAMAGGNTQYSTDEKLKDAWLDGKVETALLVNRHLNNFTIDTDVRQGEAHLSGTVNSEIDRELAIEIAKSIEGVTSVKSDIVVKKPKAHMSIHDQDTAAARSFGEWYDDATTTAAIKSELLWNSETSGLDVNVDTELGVVTLEGTVESSAEKSLIGKIAANTPGVRTVENDLKVDG